MNSFVNCNLDVISFVVVDTKFLISTIYILVRHYFPSVSTLNHFAISSWRGHSIYVRSSRTRNHCFINIKSDNRCSTHAFDLCFVVADQIKKKLMQEEAKKVGWCFDFWFPTNMLSSIVQLPHLHVINVRNDHASIRWDKYIYQTFYAKLPCLYRDYKS